MKALEELRGGLPDFAKDLRLNLQSVLTQTALSDAQKWGIAAACALATKCQPLWEAVKQDTIEHAGNDVLEDAKAAASLMGMNNVYYRFRHMVGKPVYSERPARLRMTWIGRPRTNKLDFELFCLAVSALNACESCVKAHENAVIEGGLTEDHVHDSVRIAATIAGVAQALTA